MQISEKIRNAVRQIRKYGLLATIRSYKHRAWVRWHEWKYGIRTDAYIELSELGFKNEEYKQYSPTDYSAFDCIIRALRVNPREHVFLDIGAGMGRAVILAARHPFRAVIGVEIADALAQVARENLRKCQSKLRCRRVEIITSDATKFAIPDGVSVIYFNNPFFGEVLDTVLSNVWKFALSASAPLFVVCNVPPKSRFEEQVRACAWLKPIRTLSLPNGRHALVLAAEKE